MNTRNRHCNKTQSSSTLLTLKCNVGGGERSLPEQRLPIPPTGKQPHLGGGEKGETELQSGGEEWRVSTTERRTRTHRGGRK